MTTQKQGTVKVGDTVIPQEFSHDDSKLKWVHEMNRYVDKECEVQNIDKDGFPRIKIIGDHNTALGFWWHPDYVTPVPTPAVFAPKNGDEVEVLYSGYWTISKFIGMNSGRYGCIDLSDNQYIEAKEIRPLRPTITRAEAEQKLKELGVNARIVD